MTQPRAVPGHVLVVEDSFGDLFLLDQALGEAGNLVVKSVGLVSHARAHLEALSQLGSRPAAILLDVKLPDGEGTEFLGELRRDERWQSQPVVVWTSSLDPSLAARASSLEAKFLRKPVDLAGYREVVQALVMAMDSSDRDDPSPEVGILDPAPG